MQVTVAFMANILVHINLTINSTPLSIYSDNILLLAASRSGIEAKVIKTSLEEYVVVSARNLGDAVATPAYQLTNSISPKQDNWASLLRAI